MDNNRESRFDGTTIGPEDVLLFWFGPADAPPLENQRKWYTKDEAFDRDIKERFGQALELAARGALDGWKASPRGRLALVILLDQMSRNMFRGGARAFAQDAQASKTVLEAIAAGDEKVLTPIERTFLYMPLMHAEDMGLQRKGIAAFDRLNSELSEKGDAPELQKYAEMCVGYMKKHADIVERFGRFPHRNTILGRTSTGDELEFLKQPGSSFM